MPQNLFVGRVAEGYDVGAAHVYRPEALAATADFLEAAAEGGRALEFGIGTGRVALPLAERGVEVCGVDISSDMLEQFRHKPGSEAVATTLGDFATTVVPGEFSLVYVVFNSISCLLEQSEWVQTFENAARHLSSGGRFVVELWVPDLRRFPPGAAAVAFDVSQTHVGFDTLDTANQRGVSHHYVIDERQVAGHFDSPFRYAWPAELDLMATIAGLEPCERWADWDRSPFTGESPKHVSVWRRP